MDPFYFSCPHCSAHLRVRDPMSLGRRVDCPECGKYLLLAEEQGPDGKSELRVNSAADPTPLELDEDRSGLRDSQAATSDAVRGKKRIAELTDRPSRNELSGPSTDRRERHPEGIAIKRRVWRRRPSYVVWLVTGGCVTALLAYVLLMAGGPSSTGGRARGSSGNAVVDDGDLSISADAANSVDRSKVDSSAEVALTEARMGRLGAILLNQVAADGKFPAGTFADRSLPVERRLSWQAMLADRFDDAHPPVSWDHPWNDPINDPFVRRRLHEFQNPSIAALTGGDGYPATHFVGVAGVGDDAPRLGPGDPRAGVFGDDRRTRLSDIRDGGSNTLLVLGIGEHLGSWAAGGRSTVRPLTRGPYVNGPDGFGTGTAESMLALLADGSVRVISAAADSQVLRRMATIDGEASDSAEVSGQRLAGSEEDTAVGKLVRETATSDDPADQPLEPEFEPEPVRKRVDVAESLRQPILLYDLPRARPLQEWLPEVADMIGAPIRFDAAELGTAVAGLKTPVRVRLENTTVGDILQNLLKPAGLTYRVEIDHIQLAPQK